MNLRYLLCSGKNSKAKYYALEYLHYHLPVWSFQRQRERLIASIEKRKDKDYILSRVNYYNKLEVQVKLSDDAIKIKDFKLQNYNGSKVYMFDTHHHLKYFPTNLKFILKDGDITYIPQSPSIVKSRPIGGDNSNSVVLNEDKVRHFTFVDDKKAFRQKSDIILFRGDSTNKPHRQRFLLMYFGNPLCDVGDPVPRSCQARKFQKPKLTIYQHLEHKFIVALEGNDVASNLKWVMSSNSVAVMPRPKYETWFMEGKLRPNYHYIEIRDDYSDLIERCQYYIDHPTEAEAIIAHAHEYVSQFFDRQREKLISLLVLDKYFKYTQQ